MVNYEKLKMETELDFASQLQSAINDRETFLKALKRNIDAGQSKDYIGPNSFWTPLHFSALMGFTDAVEYLLGLDANVNAIDNTNSTPLTLACQYSRISCAELLIRHGADVNMKDSTDKTALDYIDDEQDRNHLEGLIDCGLK